MTTITENPLNDDLSGTAKNDIIMALVGDDRVDDGNDGFQFDTRGLRYYIPSDDRLEGRPGNDELVSNMTAGPDHDRLYGGEGHDTFVYRLGEDTNPDVYGLDSRASGQDAVMDFEQGADRIDVRMEFTGIEEAVPNAYTGNFGLFDTNHDRALSNADDLVHVTNVRIDGVTELSTILDMPPYYQPGGPDTIDHLIVYGIDHPTEADFVPDQDLPLGLQGIEGKDSSPVISWRTRSTASPATTPSTAVALATKSRPAPATIGSWVAMATTRSMTATASRRPWTSTSSMAAMATTI
jgi:hypothetical protein